MSASISPERPGAADAVWGYRDEVWRLASRLCRHQQDAEDVTHSALLKAAWRGQRAGEPSRRCVELRLY